MRDVYKCSTTLDDFLATSKDIRNQNMPMTYTELRQRAIRQELVLRSGGLCDDDNNDVLLLLDSMVNDCFQAWLTERHVAAQRYLFPDALQMLQSIQTNFPSTCIAAITNGRGNPLDMHDTLAPWFDFCVSGEDANVFPNCKPHAHIYEVAVAEYTRRYPSHSLQRRRQDDTMNIKGVATPRRQQQHIWCHVGDCLGNDVGASASCGAHAIWLDVDDSHGVWSSRQEKETTAATADVSSSLLKNQPPTVVPQQQQQQQQQPSWSTASQNDLAQRAQRANQVKEKIAYSRITSLSELPNAIHELLLLQSSVSLVATTGTQSSNFL
jgi:hypothetical protein